jgi:pSer/pThr/pTyr-binding forkhead associated (FHA) protein
VEEKLSLGRNSRNEIVIENTFISGFHAEFLRRKDGGYELVDLKSTNGTYVNGRRVDRAELKPGDKVRFGQLDARYRDGTLPGPGRAAKGGSVPAGEKMRDAGEPPGRNTVTEAIEVPGVPTLTEAPGSATTRLASRDSGGEAAIGKAAAAPVMVPRARQGPRSDPRESRGGA